MLQQIRCVDLIAKYIVYVIRVDVLSAGIGGHTVDDLLFAFRVIDLTAR